MTDQKHTERGRKENWCFLFSEFIGARSTNGESPGDLVWWMQQSIGLTVSEEDGNTIVPHIKGPVLCNLTAVLALRSKHIYEI